MEEYIDYCLISAFCAVGFGFNVMLEIRRLKKRNPTFSFGEIWKAFIRNEWDSFIISGLIWAAFMLTTFLVSYNGASVPAWWDNWGMYIIPGIVQYGGQSTAYKFLNSTNDELKKRANQIKS